MWPFGMWPPMQMQQQPVPNMTVQPFNGMQMMMQPFSGMQMPPQQHPIAFTGPPQATPDPPQASGAGEQPERRTGVADEGNYIVIGKERIPPRPSFDDDARNLSTSYKALGAE